ncbi:MAG: MBL fold metallo-hydrolase [Proteobacteria bacterium]|nr:MBL fold metallo-hydrolase [Pseudomonadota bacterium]
MDKLARSCAVAVLLLLSLALTPTRVATAASSASRVTVLYDAFGNPSKLVKDWGYAALIEYGGKRILFDTGNDAGILEHNVRQLGIDLRHLDAVVISHRHGDHTTGLAYLLKVNPSVVIYVPQEGAFFKARLPLSFLERDPSLPADLHYYEGKPPQRWVSGTPWEQANFQIVSQTTEVFHGFFLISTQSHKPGTQEMNEISLVIRTPRGLAVIVGCSHPGVENILQQATKIDPHLYTVTGGFHLVLTPREEVERVARTLHEDLKVERVAPSHCTSELGFAVFLATFKERFDHAGLGAVIPLPSG